MGIKTTDHIDSILVTFFKRNHAQKHAHNHNYFATTKHGRLTEALHESRDKQDLR